MEKTINTIIDAALREDLGSLGDVTSDAVFTNETACYILKAKEHGVVCGINLFVNVFKHVDPEVTVTSFYKDGDKISTGDIAAEVRGKISSILKGERTALNFISHLSGIATKTNHFVAAAGSIKILDTRKTIPGLRELQKYAVKCGGGMNHRMGLFDMVMIKDNHIDGCGGIRQAVDLVRAKWGTRFKIEVETRTLCEVEEALHAGADRIMLDNMDTALMISAVKLINGRAEIEASGNMTLERLKELKNIGIDYISFGELTHTVKVFDFSLVKKDEK